jgi:hypothetical protein
MERIVKIMKIIYSRRAKEQLTDIKDYKTIAILAIYKYIDFDENTIMVKENR